MCCCSALHLKLRSRTRVGSEVELTAAWHPKGTAIVICDMWDHHWCLAAERRVQSLAPYINKLVEEARSRGVFIIHAPSGVVTSPNSIYPGTAARLRAEQAPRADPPHPLGQHYNLDAGRGEPNLPIDPVGDSCNCGRPCPGGLVGVPPWTRQIADIAIDDADAITDDGQQVWNLLTQKRIANVILCGVHLNRCVLGQPFGIRQMLRVGKTVALVRDLTDTLYHPDHPDRPPEGPTDHYEGTCRVVAHVEKYLCPTFTSNDITGGDAFRFQEDTWRGPQVCPAD